MKVVIEQTKYCYDDEQIFKDYWILLTGSPVDGN